MSDNTNRYAGMLLYGEIGSLWQCIDALEYVK